MSRFGKDSAQVIEFMTSFSRLKDWCDGPDHVLELANDDPGVRELCVRLEFSAFVLTLAEREDRQLFAHHVDPSFVSAWREYQENYDAVVSRASNLLGSSPSATYQADRSWKIADETGEEQARWIASVFSFAEDDIEYSELNEMDAAAGYLQEGIEAWRSLQRQSGLDIRGIIRRRELIPFVLIPRHVAARYGNSDKLSMLNNLQHANDAFIFGSFFASLALMRSIMESVLRDHYSAEGRDLEERIRYARSRLPPGVNEVVLNHLRKLANSILHLDRGEKISLIDFNEEQLEKEIVRLLVVLRKLIEGAP